MIAEAPQDQPPAANKGVSIAMPLFCPPGFDRRDFLTRAVGPYFKGEPLVLGISSCGTEVEYNSPDEMPTADLPCPCGNPRHWLIKWQEAQG